MVHAWHYIIDIVRPGRYEYRRPGAKGWGVDIRLLVVKPIPSPERKIKFWGCVVKKASD